MRVKIKLMVGTTLWAGAIFCCIAYTVWGAEAALIWGIVTAAAAAATSAMLAGDHIAYETAKFIVEKVTSERGRTVDRAAKSMQASDKQREDRIVARVQSANEAALRRVAGEVVGAMRDDVDAPSPFRR